MKWRSLRRFAQGLSSRLPPARLEFLEPRLPLSVNAAEQYFIYALNRARHDPVAYQQEQSLSVDLGYVHPQPPLATNSQLIDSSGFKSSEMASLNYFSHTSVTGETPNELARRFGYDLPSTVLVNGTTYLIGSQGNQIESLAAGYTTVDQALAGLIVDEGVSPPGHRNHLLGIEPFNAVAREIGVGYSYGSSAYYKHYWAIHATQSTDSGPYLTGVVFSDGNANSRYNESEGVGGVTVTAAGPAGTFTTVSLTAGGWSMKVPSGDYVVTASGGSWSGTSRVAIAVGARNREIDFVDGQDTGWIDFSRYTNASPLLAGTGGQNVPAAVIGSTPSGTPVGTLLGTSLSDIDPLAAKGIAVTSVSTGTATGAWEFSTDGGTTWASMGTPSNSASRLLREQDLVRFLPAAASSAGTASLTYRGWDQTAGVAGGTANTTTAGGASSFSITTANATAAAIVANTAPVLTPSGVDSLDPVAEDAGSPPGSTIAKIMGIAFSDVNPGTPPGLALYGLTGDTYGSWSYSADGGASWTLVGTVSAASALLLRSSDRLRFIPISNYSGSASVTYRAWDQSTGIPGGKVDLSGASAVGGATAFSSASASSSIVVIPVNDAPGYLTSHSSLRMKPIAVNSSFNFTGTTVADILGNCVSDPDASPLTGMALIGQGTGGTFYWSTNGSSWSTGTVSPTFATLLRSTDRIGFAPASGFSGDASITFRLWDQTTGAAGFNQANLSTPSSSTGGSSAFGANILTARIFVGSAGSAPTGTMNLPVRSDDGRSVASVGINFSRDIEGLDPDDFILTRDGNPAPLMGATLTGSGNSFSLGGLKASTAIGGSYTLRLRSSLTGVTDSAGTAVSDAIATSFTVVNSAAPTDLLLSSQVVAENNPLGTTVGTLSTTDSDIGDSFTYSLVTGIGSTDNSSFTISGSALGTATNLDFEAKSSYSIRIRSTDAGGLFAEKVFTITIADLVEDWSMAVPDGTEAVDGLARSGSSRLVKTGGGTLVLDRANTHTGGVVVQAGRVILRHSQALGAGRLWVNPGASVELDVGYDTVNVGSLTIDGGGIVDVGNGQLTLDTLTYVSADIKRWLQAGRGDGSGNGATGIRTRFASLQTGRTVGFKVNPDGSITVGYAAIGDTDLSGEVDIIDAARLIASNLFNAGFTASWSTGDFNYDNVFDVLDLSAFMATNWFNRGSYRESFIVSANVGGSGESQAKQISGIVAVFVGSAVDSSQGSTMTVKKSRFMVR